MGRPKGGGIYEGDTAWDFRTDISARFEKELAYWLAPENHFKDGYWTQRVLAIIEGILLLEKHYFGSTVILSRQNPTAVERWRETFFNIWDGNWKEEETYFPSNEPEYRKQHRPAVVSMFDRLKSIAVYWKTSDAPRTFVPLHPAYPLPYFSIKRLINKNSKSNQEEIHADRFITDQLQALMKDIIFYLSPEKREEVIGFNVEQVWVAADVLAFLCKAYEQTPGINAKGVQQWRETSVDIWKQTDPELEETDFLYQEVMAVFDRLEAIARQYPPYEW
jgi:hypothetical protein